MFVVLGCSQLRELGSSNAPANTANSDPSNTDSASADTSGGLTASADPVADINRMADRFLIEKSFRAKMTGKGDKDMKTDLEFVAPDRFRLIRGPGLETIIIGKDIYLQTGNTWQKMPGGLGSSVPDLRAAFDKEGRKWFSDVKYIGEDTANGKPSLVYQYKNKGHENMGENDSKVWIAKSDGLPVKIEARYKTGALKSMLIEYEYDPTIKIEPPVTK